MTGRVCSRCGWGLHGDICGKCDQPAEGRVSSAERDDDGFLLDEDGNAYGWCNSCGEEAPAGSECCDDGEVVPDA